MLVWLLLGSIVMANAGDTTLLRVPKIVAFDLDGTIWYPDMYMLWGGGAPFEVVDAKRTLTDCRGQQVNLLGVSGQILHDINTKEEFKDTHVAWVSKTDEPSWADECLRKFETPGGIHLIETAQHSHSYKGSKAEHFRNLQRETNVAFEDMLFFDNESGNIRTVGALGVPSIYCPDGMTQNIWEEGLRTFEMSKK